MVKFIGSDKSEWTVEANLRILRDIQRKTGKTITDLFAVLQAGTFDVDLIIDFADCVTRKERESRGVKMDDFIDSALTLESIGRFGDAFGASLLAAFPENEGTAGNATAPFAHGETTI